MEAEQTANSRTSWGQVGRASRSLGQLWQVPTFCAGLLAFVVVAVTAPCRGDNTAALFQAEAAHLRHGLESGQEKPAALIAEAENLLTRLPQFPQKAGEVHFLAGSAYYRQRTPDGRVANGKQATHHLEEALALGVADADMPALQYRLGFTLHKQGQDPSRAIELMAKSVAKGADRPAQAYGMLAEAYLALAKPNIEAALSASEKQLELTDDRNVEEMAHARLLRGELLLRKEERQEALKELERIGPSAPRPVRLKARLLQARICEEEGSWNGAARLWQELLEDADAVPGGKARVLYAVGLAYANSSPPRPEQALANWEQAYKLGGDEGLAAGLRLGETLFYGSQAQIESGVAIWRQVLETVRTVNDYHIEALELRRAREILEKACRYFLESQDFEHTRQIADLYRKIAPPGAAEECVAQAAEGLARQLREQVKQLSSQEAANKMKEAKAQFHRAAAAYETAAAAHTDEGQASGYWHGAQCYLEAGDFGRASVVLDKFLGLEKNDARLAEGWLAKAEACAAQGDKAASRQAYYRCIEIPRTPFASRARYQLAVEEIKDEKYQLAKDILEENLKNQGPMQDREAHEKSIYKMADLLYLMKDFYLAASRYKEASRQYPSNRAALAARDKIGECYRKLAEQAKEKMLAAADEDTKAQHQRTQLAWLKQAGKAYQDLADELEHKGRPLRPVELGLLRDAFFAAADMHCDMRDYAEALRLYEKIQEKYRERVEGLMACYKIYLCVRVMAYAQEDRDNKLRGAATDAIKKAKADLEKMPEESDAFRGGEGVWPKRKWQQELATIEQSLTQPAPPRRAGSVID